MKSQLYCNQCGTVNDIQFHYCLTCGNPIGKLLYSPHEPKTKVPTLNNINWDDYDVKFYLLTGNHIADKGALKF